MLVVDRVLLARTVQLHLECHLRLVDFDVFAVRLETFGEHLQKDLRTGRQDVNDGLPVFVGLQLHVALVALEGKDDGGILDGLVVVRPQDRDFDLRGGRRSLVFAPTMIGVLGANGQAGG